VQSAISGQIAQLERVVGTQLVERSAGMTGTTLTPAGRVLMSHVEEILARFEAARMDIHAMTRGADAAVRISALEGVGARRLPEILRAFADSFPDVRVAIHETCSDELDFDRLAGGELDLMITELPLPDGPFEHVLLERDPYVLLVAADSLLAKQPDPPDASQLARVQLLLPTPTRRVDRLVTHLVEIGVEQQAALRARSVSSLQAAVGAGLGVAVIPALAVDRQDESTVAIGVPGLLPERQIVLARHRERQYSPPVLRLIDILEESFRRERRE
jgi:DNA-binding transcriptional LysR family regulator